MTATIETTADLKARAFAYIDAVGRRDFDRVAELLHPDLEFVGPGKPLHGAAAYLAALRRLGTVLVRNDVHTVVADGADACIFYDFVTDTDVGAVPSAEWISFDGGLIRSLRLVFHTASWPRVMEEVARRG